MNIRIKTTSYKLTAEAASYLDERLHAIEKFIGEHSDAARCEVEVGRASGHSEHGDVWRAEINLLHLGQNLRAESEAQSINAAIDEVKDEIVRQLRRGKRLHIRLARRGGALLKRFVRFGEEEEEE